MGDYTEIVVLLDRSGSMQSAKSDHEGGLNSFVADQRDLSGDVRFSLIQFDSQAPCEVIYDGIPVSEVGKCVLIPRGGTPLLDALGQSIAHVQTRLGKQGRKPDQLIFMVITDGLENQSHEFNKTRVKALIEEREKDSWRFLFLGANIDAFAEAGGLGISAHTTLDFANNSVGVRSLYGSTSRNIQATHHAGSQGLSQEAVLSNLNYTDEQRKQAADVQASSTTKKGPE